MTRSCLSARPSAVAASADLFRRTIAAPRWVKNELTLDHSTGVQLSRLLAQREFQRLCYCGDSRTVQFGKDVTPGDGDQNLAAVYAGRSRRCPGALALTFLFSPDYDTASCQTL